MPFFKAIIFLLPYVALLWITISNWLRLEKSDKYLIAVLSGLCLIIHVFYHLFIHQMPVIRYGPFFFIDEFGYDNYSWAIALEWKAGNFPPLWTDQYLGTLHTGWNRILAFLYYLLGHKPWLGAGVNVVAGVLLVPLVFLATREIFQTGREKQQKETLPLKKPLLAQQLKELFKSSPEFSAAGITTIYFGFAFWSGFLLRDMILTAMFLASIFLILRIYKKRKPWDILALVLILHGLSILRVYSVGFLLAGPIVYFLFFHRYKKRAWIVLGAGVLLMLGARILIPIRDYQDQLLYSFLNNLPDEGKTSLGSVLFCVRGIPRFFLSPYAWYVSPGAPVIEYMLYPGQWLLYLLIIPFFLIFIFE